MHLIFYPVGIRKVVDEWIKWVETRLVPLAFENPKLVPEGPKDKDGNLLAKGFFNTNIGIRYGVFGTYEAVFPENCKDAVLTLFRANDGYKGFTKFSSFDNLKVKAKIESLRIALGLEKIPEFQLDKRIALPDGIGNDIRIIVIGVRYDRVHDFPNGLRHEAL